MLTPVCRATNTMLHRTTLLHAIPSPHRLAQHKAPHISDASRARVAGCYTRGRTRTRYSQCALIRLATSMKHRSIIREPYQAHASHKAARIGSSYVFGRVFVFVSVLRQMSRRCSFFLKEFGCQTFLMHAYSLVSLVSTCSATVNAECDTNGVVRFLVCCATFALSVGLFSTRSCFFSGHVSSNAL